MSVQVSYKKQTLLGIIGLLIIFLIIEIIANVWWITQVNCEFQENEIFSDMNEEQKKQLCADLFDVKVSGMELIPNQHSKSITINNQGFRGDDFNIEKSDSVYRIFMLGGSTMFGHGATSDETTIPGFVQKFFNEEFGENEIQVINAGIQGADSSDELNLIKNKILNYSPDMIIIYDGWNDLRQQHTPEKVSNNWKTVCKLGKQNTFSTLISLQPISGFGKKPLTEQELENVRIGTDYFGNILSESQNRYEEYSNRLKILDECDNTLDLRSVFDNEASPIYWDQGHVSDRGNYLIAQKIKEMVLEELPSELPELDQNSVIKDEKMIKVEDQIKSMIAAYKTPIMINDILSIELKNQDETGNFMYKTQTKSFNDELISIIIEIEKDEKLPNEKSVKIRTINETTNSEISNVTYFLKIIKDERMLFSDYFFVKNEILVLDVLTNGEEKIKVLGKRQYDHNAIIVEENIPIQISGPILEIGKDYEFNIELRTIYDQNNWIFGLDDFSVRVIP